MTILIPTAIIVAVIAALAHWWLRSWLAVLDWREHAAERTAVVEAEAITRAAAEGGAS